ncbi:MAG: F0F1 ATP synthase subunit alpha [Armatimonadota bacterium]
MIRPEEISTIIKKEIENYRPIIEEIKYGTCMQVGDNIATVYGLSDAKAGELLEFPGGVYGIVFNLAEDSIGCVILGDDRHIKEGDPVKGTGRIVQVGVGDAYKGRVLNALGQPVDEKGEIKPETYRPIEFPAPKVIQRQPVDTPLQTGLKCIDALVPIGRGQRELIIGDRQTGKTAIAIDAIINQKEENVICIYVAIGQKTNNVASIVDTLTKYGCMDYTIIITANANEPPSMLYIAPYAGCAMAEHFMYQGKDVLIIYDDLTKHAKAYREISLLLRRPPGREAYPGDVFYLHSRLLERSAKLSEDLGGGSITALPIIETQLGDVSAYIPTNLISITDGQIYLDTDLFYQGIRPAVDVGLSVSRVGGAAQIKGMKQVAGPLRLDLAQYRELAAFTKFSSDELDKTSQEQLERGARITQVLKQKQFVPVDVASQIVLIYLAVNGYLREVQIKNIEKYEGRYIKFIKDKYPQLLEYIKQRKAVDDEIVKLIHDSFMSFKESISSEIN